MIAMAFLLSSFPATLGDVEAGDKQIPQILEFGIDGKSTIQSLGPCQVGIGGINLLSHMPEGEYDICVNVTKHCTTPMDCDVKFFVDVFKLDDLPWEELYCTDFEDPADIYNNWDSVDDTTDSTSGPGGIDTWTWTDQRSHSPSHSFRCTQFDDHYMGNQLDYLEVTVQNDDGDGGSYDLMKLDFWYWVEGEMVDGGGAGDILEDYGQIQVSLDGGTSWLTWSQAYWDSEGEWLNDGLDDPDERYLPSISGISAIPELIFRFRWISGPTIQNEGWYVDDICFYGQNSPHPDFLWQSHSLHVMNVSEMYSEFCFPQTWFAEEGEYQFQIWMINETWGCDVEYPQADKFIFNVTVGDFVDLAVIDNDYFGGPDFMMGDDLLVESSVTNLGTIDAIDVPLTFSIKSQIETTLFMDFVEGGHYDPDDYDPYSDDAWDFGPWKANDWGAGPAAQITEDFDFVSPNHAWHIADASPYYTAAMDMMFMLDLENIGVDLADYEDVIDFDLEFMINYRLAPGDEIYPMVWEDGGLWFLGSAPHTGSTGGWVSMLYSDWLGPYHNPAIDDNLADTLIRYFGTDVHDIGFAVWPGSNYNVGPWTGVQIDNARLYSIVAGAEVFSEVIIIPEIKCETVTDPADIIDLDSLDGLYWPDMPTGDFIEEKILPLDDPDPEDPINDDNSMGKKFFVYTDITCAAEHEVEHEDLTTCDGSWWHITTSGYNNYAWCGDESTGVYGQDWNEALVLLDDEDDPSFDCSGESVITFEFDSYEDIEGYDFDWGMIEFNPAVSEPGSHWYSYQGEYYESGAFWNFEVENIDPTDLYCLATATWFDVDVGMTFTDDMGFRFRFISDAGYEYRGWLIDNIEVTGLLSGDVYYEVNPCDDMDRFFITGICGGDWWVEEDHPVTPFSDGWTCSDMNPAIAPDLPNDVNNALVWSTSVPQAINAELTFYHDFDLEMGADWCYLEFSTDGGSTFIAPTAFSGVGAAYYAIDMTPFVGENVLIRWRVLTDDAVHSAYYHVEDMCITGQLDTEAPVTTGTLTGTMLHGWYSTGVTFTATATDDVSGVDAIYYKIDGGSTLTYTGPITISVNGEHYIEYWAVDNVGNEEAHHITGTFKIDTGSAPSCSITAPGNGIYLFGNKILDAGSKPIIIGGITVGASASDADSGVYRVIFSLDGTVFGEDTSAPYEAYMGMKHTGAGTITVTAEDFTGNTASDTLAVTYFKFL